jgi:hypothetical protein
MIDIAVGLDDWLVLMCIFQVRIIHICHGTNPKSHDVANPNVYKLTQLLHSLPLHGTT